MKKTPPLNTVGRYTLAPPWSTASTVIYTCEAIRSFDDIGKLGKDVYKTYYEPMGVVEGANINGSPFSFATEKAKDPFIITLIGNDNSVIYIPDTFILSYPQSGEYKYSHMVLSISLGALPDYLDLSVVKTAVMNAAAQTSGITPVVTEHKIPARDNPTTSQHDLLEATRLAAISTLETDAAKVLRLEQEKILLNQKINSLTLALLAAQ